MDRKIILCGETVFYDFQPKNVKNINLRIRPNGTILVSAPHGIKQELIERFLIQKQALILNGLQKCKEYDENRAAKQAERSFKDGCMVWLLGEQMPVQVVAVIQSESVTVSHNCLRIESTDPENNARNEWLFKEYVQKAFAPLLLDCCKSVYPRFAPLGVPIPQIKQQFMTSRWGSCQPQKRIVNFNSRLYYFPREMTEYVVCHEFTHFLVPNHSARFYEQLEAALPDFRRQKQIFDGLVKQIILY